MKPIGHSAGAYMVTSRNTILSQYEADEYGHKLGLSFGQKYQILFCVI